MPRLPRNLLIEKGATTHKVWRAHNKDFLLDPHPEKNAYLQHLNLAFDKHLKRSNIYAICVMSNHSHEAFEILDDLDTFSNFMRQHHSRFGQMFNKRHHRLGKVAQDRPRTQLVESDEYLMTLVFYIHANPIRAGMVKDAKDYLFSTHKLYAYGRREAWMKHITFPSWYMDLGKNMAQRQHRYRQLFDAYLRYWGMQKVPWNHYGWGSVLWVTSRRTDILQKAKALRSGSSPPT